MINTEGFLLGTTTSSESLIGLFSDGTKMINTDALSEIALRMSPNDFIERCTIDRSFAATCDNMLVWKRKLERDYSRYTGTNGKNNFINDNIKLWFDLRFGRTDHGSPLKQYSDALFSSSINPRKKYIGITRVLFDVKVTKINGGSSKEIVPNPGMFLSFFDDKILRMMEELLAVSQYNLGDFMIYQPDALKQLQSVFTNAKVNTYFTDMLQLATHADHYDDLWFCGLFNGLTARFQFFHSTLTQYTITPIDLQLCPKNDRHIKYGYVGYLRHGQLLAQDWLMGRV